MDFKFALLLELRDICAANKIDMLLSGSLLEAAFSEAEFDPKWDDLEVVLSGKGFRKLHLICKEASFEQEHPNRKLESLFNNPKFPGFFAKYTATDTTYLHLGRKSGFKYNGISINIIIMTNDLPDTAKGRGANVLREHYLNIIDVERGYKTRNIKYHFWKAVFTFAGNKLQKRLFNGYIKNWTDKKGGRFYSPARGIYRRVWKNFFKTQVVKELNGEQFCCPKRYFTRKVSGKMRDFKVLYSESIPYSDYIGVLAARGLDPNSVIDDYVKQNRKYREDLKHGRKGKRYYNAAFYSTLIRVEMPKRLATMNNLSLENEEYRVIMEEYFENAVTYSKYGVTPYVSQKTFLDGARAYAENMISTYNRGEKFIKNAIIKMIDNIPEEHFKDSCITDSLRMRMNDSCGEPPSVTKEQLKEVINAKDFIPGEWYPHARRGDS